MTIMLWVTALIALLEIALFGPNVLWRSRKILAAFIVIAAPFCAAGTAVAFPGLFTALLLAASLMRAFNMIRVIHGRMHDRYMRTAARRTSLVLIAAQVVIACLWMVWHNYDISGHYIWLAIAVLQCTAAVVLLASTLRRLQHTAWPHTEEHYTDMELPTLTVAIPARNETDELQQCLERIIASDYPKLEIIVLDDCSQTRRTPEIIRGFAHSGVRFIPGHEPLETWLPKNQAYQRLAEEASGEYIVFCGVDVRLERDALRKLMGMTLSKRKQMMSILPDRASDVRAVFSPAQTLRYFWELVPPRRLFGKPAVLSSCWIINKDALHAAGGFDAVRRSVVPEAYFARHLAATDGYSFMRAGSTLGIASVKGVNEQRDTAVRIRYPQLHRRPEQVFFMFCTELFLFIMPVILAFAGYWLHIGLSATLLATAAAVLLMLINALVVRATNISSATLGFLALPVVAAYDLGIMCYSMWKYEFSTVDWKGRNVCVPAMHVIPRLPKID